MAMTVSKMAEYYTLGITVLMVNHKTDEKGSTWMWWYLSRVNDSYLQTAQITDSIRTYHSSVLGRPSLRSAMLEVERALESGLEEVARGLQWFGCNLSTGGIPAGKSAERFLKVKVLRKRKPLDHDCNTCWSIQTELPGQIPSQGGNQSRDQKTKMSH